jgi:hypothetical protein
VNGNSRTVRLRRAGQLSDSRPDTPPNADQTRTLAARAQRHGTLTPAEAARLIAGVERLIADRDRAEAAVARLDRMADAWRERLPAAIRTATAVDAIHAVTRRTTTPKETRR